MTDISSIHKRFLTPYTEYSSTNSLMTLLVGDFQKLVFIFYITHKAYETLTSKKGNRFQPNPYTYFPVIYQEELLKDDMDIFTHLISNPDSFFDYLRKGLKSNSATDEDLIQFILNSPFNRTKFTLMTVKLLYFIIFTNTIAFSTSKINNSNFRLYRVSHSEEKEKEFYNIQSPNKILMHGTKIHNVYSIMRNGIKSMSKTEYQQNGAAYGNGVYLSEDIDTATMYGRSVESVCILFFDCKNLNEIKNIKYFVQQEYDIILRCILWIESKSVFKRKVDISKIIEYANSIKYEPTQMLQLENLKISSDQLSIPSKNESANSKEVTESARFKKEIIERFLNIPSKANEKNILKCNFLQIDNYLSPLLVIVMPDEQTDLYKDIYRYKLPGILLAVYFPHKNPKNMEYPHTPPMIRVVSPMFIDGTGRVTKGGSICADTLYPEGWSPANTLEALIRNLVITISTEGSREGPGRVDGNRLGKSYSYEDYKFSYSQTAGFHSYTAI